MEHNESFQTKNEADKCARYSVTFGAVTKHHTGAVGLSRSRSDQRHTFIYTDMNVYAMFGPLGKTQINEYKERSKDTTEINT
jgi:hypothetical protein